MNWRRRRRDWDDIFDIFGREFDEIFERIFKDIDEFFRSVEKSEFKPFIRGFSIRIGPDGKPEIKEFGTKPEAIRKGIDIQRLNDREQIIDENHQVVKDEYWQRSKYYEEYKDMLASLKHVESNTFPAEYNEEEFVRFENIDGAISLEKTEVAKKWLDCDVFVNIPISKHHMTTLLTGALKNIMGVSTREANITFHLGSGERNDPDYIAQCIVDQNMLKKTNLCIVDATEVIIDNGPSGPGTIEIPAKIVAGTDIVAIDALCSTFIGYEPDEILTTVKGHEMGLGNMNYNEMNIVELTV